MAFPLLFRTFYTSYYEENTRDKTKLNCKTCPADGFY